MSVLSLTFGCLLIMFVVTGSVDGYCLHRDYGRWKHRWSNTPQSASCASRQRITREWWRTATVRYRIVTSQLTLDECAGGDQEAATERLEVLQGIALLDESDDAETLAELLIDRKAIPASEPCDALHIATAATNADSTRVETRGVENAESNAGGEIKLH